MSIDLGGITSFVSIALEGVDEVKSQLDNLVTKANALKDIKFKVKAEVKDVDTSIFTKVQESLNKKPLLFTGAMEGVQALSNAMQAILNSAYMMREIDVFGGVTDATKEAADKIALVQKRVAACAQSFQELQDTPEIAIKFENEEFFRQFNAAMTNLDALGTKMKDVSSQMAKNFEPVQKTLEAMQKLESKAPRATMPRSSGATVEVPPSPETKSAVKETVKKDITAGIQEAVKEVAKKPLELPPVAVTAKEINTGEIKKQLTSALTNISDSLKTGMPFNQVFNQMIGNRGGAEVGIGSTYEKVLREGLGMAGDAQTSISLVDKFMPQDVQARIKEVNAALAELADTYAGLASSDGEVFVTEKDATRIKELTKAVLTAREELANNLLKSGNFDEGNLVAQHELIKATTQQKQQIETTLALLGRRSDVLSREAELQKNILSIIKRGHDAEADVLAIRRNASEALKQQTDYAAMLMQQQEKIGSLGDNAHNNSLRKSLAEEARAMLSIASLTAPVKSYEQIFSKQMDAASIQYSLKAQEDFHKAVERTTIELKNGLKPSFDDVLKAATLYSSTSAKAFSDSSREAAALKNLMKNLQTQYDAISENRDLSSLEQMKSITMAQLNLKGFGAGGASEKTLANREKALNVEIEIAKTTQRINEDFGKLLILQETGFDAVANMSKLQKAYFEALKSGVPVEEKLVALATDKRTALQNLIEYQKKVASEAKNVLLTEEQQMELRKLSVDLLKQAASLQRSHGKSVKTSDGYITQKSIQTDLAAANAEVSAKEKELALMGRLKSEESAVTEMARVRAETENKILNILARSQEVIGSNKATYASLTTAVDSYIEAMRKGIDIREIQVDLEKAEQQALNRAVQEHQALEKIMTNEKAAHIARVTAAKQYLEVTNQIKSIVGSREMRAFTAQQDFKVDAGYLNAAVDRYNAVVKSEGKKGDQPKTVSPSIADVAKLSLTQEQVLAKSSAEADRLAQSMLKVKEEILSGNNVLKNFRELQSLIVQSAERGVPVNSETLALLINQEEVMRRLAEASSRIIKTGRDSNSPGVAAHAYTMGKEYIEAARNMLGPDAFRKMGFSQMEKELNNLRDKAGTVLKGSLAAARHEADALYESLAKVNVKTEAIARPTGKKSFDDHRANLERILPIITKIAQQEKEISLMPQYMEKATSEELADQYKRVAVLERVKTLIQQIRAEQDRYTAAAGKLGLADDKAYSATLGGRRAAVEAANQTGDHKSYLRMIESQKKQAALSAELAEVAKSSGIAQLNTEKLANALNAAVKPSKEVAQNLRLSEKSQQRKAAQAAGQDFFDIGRMKWFLQLRLFWSSFTNMQQVVQQTIEFSHTLNVLRAVAQTTGEQLGEIHGKVVEIGEDLPIAYNKIAEATLAVAKAGFTAQESVDVVAKSARLAQATGDDLKKIADIQTVILHAWGLGADQSGVIADQLYNTVAKSRADIEGLGSALGYVAGIAPNANVSLQETLAVFGMLSNAGLAMSKSGTYMRQFLNNLLNPSEKLIATLNRVGLTAADVNPRLNTLQDIFQKFKSKDVQLSDIFEGMDLRAASAFSIMVKNADTFSDFSKMVGESGTVNKAYVHTIKDVTAAAGFLQNQFTGLADTLGNTFAPITIFVFEVIGKLFGALRDGAAFLQRNQLTSTLTSMALAGVAAAASLSAIVKLFASVATFAGTMGLASTGAGTAIAGMAGSIGLVGAALIAAGVAAAAFFKYFYGQEHAEALRRIEEMQDAITELQQISQQQITIKMKVEAALDALDTIKTEMDVIQNTAANSVGNLSLIRGSQRSILLAADMSENETLKKASEEVKARKLVITPEMDEAAVQAAVRDFFEVFAKASEKVGEESGKAFADGLKKSTSQAGKIAAESLAAVEGSIRAISSVLDSPYLKGEGKVIHPEWGEMVRSMKGFISDIEKAKNIKDLHDIFKELSKETEQFGTNFDGVAEAIASGNFAEAQEALLRRTKEVADGFRELKIRATSTWKDESLFGFAGVDAKFQDVMREAASAAAGIEALNKNLVGDGKDEERLTTLVAKIRELQEALDKAGIRAGISDDGLFSRIDQALKDVDSRISEARALDASNTEKAQDIARGGEVTEESRAAAVRRMMHDAEQNAKELQTMMKTLTESGELLSVLPSPEGFDVYTQHVKKASQGLKSLVEEMQKVQEHNARFGGETQFPVALEKNIVKSIQDYAETINLLKKARGEAMSVESLVSAARDVAGTAGGKFDVDSILRITKAGESALTIIRELGNADFGTPYQEYLSRVITQWRELNEMARHNGMATYMGKARMEAAKTYRAVVEHNKAMSKSIRLNSATLSGYTAAIASMGRLQKIFSSKTVDADILGIAKALDSADVFIAKLDALTENVQNFKDASAEATAFLEMFSSGQELTKEAVDQWKALGDSIRDSMDSATKSLVSTRKELVSMSSEITKSYVDQAKAAYDFKMQLYDIDRSFIQNGNTKSFFDMAAINSLRQFISQNAQNFSAPDMRNELKGLQKALLDFYKNNPYTDAGVGARSEAIAIQDRINKLFEAERQITLAEIELRKAYYTEVTSKLGSMDSSLKNVNAVLQSQQSKNTGIFEQLRGAVTKKDREPSLHPTYLPKDRYALVHKYESGVAAGGNVHAIGYDRAGGTSYGSVQLSSETMRTFVSWLEKQPDEIAKSLAAELKNSLTTRTGKSYSESSWNTGKKTGAGPDAWHKVAAQNGGALDAWSHKFIDMTHIVDNYAKVLQETGVDLAKQSVAVQAAMHSTFVQHGRHGVDIFKKAHAASGSGDVNNAQFLDNLYAERSRRGRFKSSSDTVYGAVLQRLQKNEVTDAKNMLREGLKGHTDEPVKEAVVKGTGAIVSAIAGEHNAVTGGTEEAVKKLTAAQENANVLKNMQGAGISGATQADYKWLSVDQAIEAYKAKLTNVNVRTQQLFDGLADSVSTGLGNAITSAMRAVGTDKSWYDAASEAIENITWQMIDMWIQANMKNLSDAFMTGDWGIFTHGWGGGRDRYPTQGSVGQTTGMSAENPIVDMVTQQFSDNVAVEGTQLLQKNQQLLQEGTNLQQENMQNVNAQTNLQMESMNIQQFQLAIQQFQMAIQQFQAAASSGGGGGGGGMGADPSMAAGFIPKAGGGAGAAGAGAGAKAGAGAGAGAGGGGGAAAAGGLGALGWAAIIIAIIAIIVGLIAWGDSKRRSKNEKRRVREKHKRERREAWENSQDGVFAYGTGGKVKGTRTGKDTALIAATPGEQIMNEDISRQLGDDFFENLNAGNIEAAYASLPMKHKESSLNNIASPAAAEGGQFQSTASSRKDQQINIMNVTDPRLMENFLSHPRGRRLIQNIAGHGVQRVKG